MSYCRWSSDNWRCDVYVYADAGGGWTTHVAGVRHVGEIKPMPLRWLDLPNGAELYNEHMDSVKACPLVPIGLPHDGKSFNHATPGECADWLAELSGLGYNVPRGVIEALREEQHEIMSGSVEGHAAKPSPDAKGALPQV